MPFTADHRFCVCFYKVHFHIALILFLKFRETALVFKESFKSFVRVHNALLYGLAAGLFDPFIFLIIGDEVIVKPFGKIHARHKFLFFFINFFIMGKVKIINIPAGPDRPVDCLPLLLCRVNFRFEAPEQSLHPPFPVPALQRLN